MLTFITTIDPTSRLIAVELWGMVFSGLDLVSRNGDIVITQ